MKKYVVGVALAVLIAGSAFLFWPSNDAVNNTVTPPRSGLYLAMGDSVAAGVGLKDYSDSSACDRTEQAYPNLVAAKLGYTLHSVACGGATTQEGLLGPQDVNRLAVYPQLKAVQTSKPNLITITIGANDADWTALIQKCYSSVCGSVEDTLAVSGNVDKAATNLGQLLSQVKKDYPTTTPLIMVTGYYLLFPSNPNFGCTELRGIDPSELAWVKQLQTTINDTLQTTTAQYDFASYVPVSFAGHELCSSEPWIQGIGAKAAYHPTQAGQSAIANQIVSALKTKELGR